MSTITTHWDGEDVEMEVEDPVDFQACLREKMMDKKLSESMQRFDAAAAAAAKAREPVPTNCEDCGGVFGRIPNKWFGTDESLPACPECVEKREAKERQEQHLELWLERTPVDYQRATEDKVREQLRPALEWQPADGCQRLGMTGPPGCGKTMALALLAKKLQLRFHWTNGFSARSIYNLSVTGTDGERHENGGKWRRFMDTQLLVLDDIDKGNPTESWASALYDLLECRNSNCRPTIWTSNHGPGGLAQKFAKCGDPDLADAIERRLCGGAQIISVRT